jgi:hypothetical protein
VKPLASKNPRIDPVAGGNARRGVLCHFRLRLGEQEWIVRRSKLDWVIVRPVILTDGPKTNAYCALVDPRDWTCGFISRADVADFLVKQIDDDAFLHKAPVLTSSLYYFEEQAHAAAAPPSSVMNTRRFMSDLGPSSPGAQQPAPSRGV